jgi:hypothetical protein
VNPFVFTQPKDIDAVLAALAAPGARPIAGGTNLLDIHDIEVLFADEEDRIVSKQLGAKGVGEIGIAGVAAAVANAVFHATCKRLRTTPITPDKVLLGDHEVPVRK